jgi:hypothetical protein
LYHIIWMGKNTPKVAPKIILIFEGWGWIELWKKNSLTRKHIVESSPHQYGGLGKKKKEIAKIFIYFQVFEIYFSNCQKKKKVQCKYLQVHRKNIINSFFLLKPIPTIVKKECT